MIALTRRSMLATAALSALAPRLAFARPAQDIRFAAFLEGCYQRELKRDPTRQSALGLKDAQDRWTDVSEAHQAEGAAQVRENLAQLRDFDTQTLSPAARLSRELFAYNAGQELTMHRWRHNYYPLCQMHGLQRTIPHTLINYHPIENRKDAQDYIARLNGVPALIAQQIVVLNANAAQGAQPPRFVYPIVAGTCRNLIAGAPFDGGADSPIFSDFKGKIGKLPLSSGEKAALVGQAASALTGSFAPGFRDLIAWLQAAEKTATYDAGVWALPDGGAYYAATLENETTLPLTAEAVHRLGLEHTARVQHEMRKLMGRVDFRGSLQDFFTFVRSDARFYFPNNAQGRDAYMTQTRAVIDDMSARLGQVINRKPKHKLLVKAVEPWLEKSAGTAGYFGGSADGTKPGILYINLVDMKQLPKYELSALAYHEGVPGHHVEISISQELPDIPKFRRYGGYTAYSEGWGLYSEQLPKEIGLYRDPYQDFGRLSMELLRTTRLVVDTGLHAKRWSREQAIAYLDENLSESHSDNVTSVNRYCVVPGQATAYMIGKLKILELRERARARMGAHFDIRSFHDNLLGNGPVPLPVMDAVMTSWMSGHAN
ncbi:MAG: DUF885 domain-containing protein [Rhizomicrobium sp.]